MKKQGILILIGMLFSILSFAQGQGGERRNFNSEEMIKRQTEEMKTSLSLTAEQVVKVEALNKKYGKKMSEAFEGAQEDRTVMREKMAKMREEKNTELKGILTAEQLKKHQEDEKKRMEEMRKRREENKNNPPEKSGAQRGGGNK